MDREVRSGDPISPKADSGIILERKNEERNPQCVYVCVCAHVHTHARACAMIALMQNKDD